MQQDLSYPWNVWIYQQQNNWSKDNLKVMQKISTVQDFVEFDKQLRLNYEQILNKHIFIMKDNIIPLWEEKENIQGGCWTFKTSMHDSLEHFLHIFLLIITNNFIEEDSFNKNINGITFCIKNNNNCIIQVWNDSYKKLKDNDIKHHYYVRETFGCNIIYKKHIR